MPVPRTSFRRSNEALYDYLDSVLGLYIKGSTFYVNSATGVDDVNHGDKWSTPFATLDYAIGSCTANNGDLILLAPNHAETITGAGGIACDVAGVTIIGLGHGKQVPRFLMDGGTAVTLTVTAADVTIQNVEFAAGHADIVTCIDLDATDFRMEGCSFFDNTSAENFLAIITAGSTTDNVCDGLTLLNNYVYSPDAAATNFIALTGDCDRLVAKYNTVLLPAGTDSAFLKQAAGDDVQGVDIQWNFLQHAMTAGDLFIDNDQSDNTGIVAHNRCKHVDVTGAHSLIDCDGVGLFDNLSNSTATTSGFVLPAIDVDL